DRPGGRQQEPIPEADAALLAGPDADRERFDQRSRVVRQLVGKRERVILVDRDVAGERPVDWRCREEADVRAEVVAAVAALRAAAARDAGLERDALTDWMLRGS